TARMQGISRAKPLASWRWAFAAARAALAAQGACVRGPCPTSPKNARQLHQGHHQWRTCQTRPNHQLNNSDCVKYKKNSSSPIEWFGGRPAWIKRIRCFLARPPARLLVTVCLMGSFLAITPRGGPIENFRQETHLERLASIDDRPRGHTMFAC